MTAITIRNVPEHVRDELAARAARSGRSVRARVSGNAVSSADIIAIIRDIRGD